MEINGIKTLLIAGVAALLAGCGGTSSTSSIRITGTAATGLAMGGAVLTATCKVGTGTVTTNSDGTYTLDITNGQAPCLITATKNGVTLRSVASAPGNVNVTPLTDMVVTALAQQAGVPASTFTPISTPAAFAIVNNTARVNATVTQVVVAINTQYGTTINANDVLNTKLVPGTSPIDLAMDSIAAQPNPPFTPGGAVNPTVAAVISTTVTTAVNNSQGNYVPPTGAV